MISQYHKLDSYRMVIVYFLLYQHFHILITYNLITNYIFSGIWQCRAVKLRSHQQMPFDFWVRLQSIFELSSLHSPSV